MVPGGGGGGDGPPLPPPRPPPLTVSRNGFGFFVFKWLMRLAVPAAITETAATIPMNMGSPMIGAKGPRARGKALLPREGVTDDPIDGSQPVH